ncbi:3-hydroxyacyl-CoA dehydrogenase [Micromonospora sp. WMMD558]|uniref:3-hydroxyacyl-CoA dehydrogenase n=1 Tax=Micromonospora sp. WMMD558 TaxID=3403462 RepID=UPI003BF46D1D
MRPVAVVGTGSIGVAFGIVFASASRYVRMWDPIADSLGRARHDIADRLAMLASRGLLREPAEDVAARITFHDELEHALWDVELVQECAPEDIDLKRRLFDLLGRHAPADAVLASSSSALIPSQYGAGLDFQDRILGAHPGNPPYLLRVIELVRSPETSDKFLDLAAEIYADAGLTAVFVRKEVEGFLFNRLQGALLREAYCLVRDGVATVEDIDEVVRSGLGLRWSLMGPFETVDLNTRGGVQAHAARMGPAYERMGAERGQHDPWTPDLVASVVAQRRRLLPLDAWEQRVRWRDERLMLLRSFKDLQEES